MTCSFLETAVKKKHASGLTVRLLENILEKI